MDNTGVGGASAGAAAAAAVFDGNIKSWPTDGALNIRSAPNSSLNVCNVPTDQKAFIRYYACEWMKNQPAGNPRQQAQQAIQSAQVLYGELASKGYMDN